MNWSRRLSCCEESLRSGRPCLAQGQVGWKLQFPDSGTRSCEMVVGREMRRSLQEKVLENYCPDLQASFLNLILNLHAPLPPPRCHTWHQGLRRALCIHLFDRWNSPTFRGHCLPRRRHSQQKLQRWLVSLVGRVVSHLGHRRPRGVGAELGNRSGLQDAAVLGRSTPKNHICIAKSLWSGVKELATLRDCTGVKSALWEQLAWSLTIPGLAALTFWPGSQDLASG